MVQRHDQHLPIIQSDAGFSEIVTAERDWLIRWFSPRCGGQPSVAEDLTQETLIQAWQIRARFTSGERGIRPWLAAVARNVFLRWQRAVGRSRLAQLETEVANALPATDDALDPVWFSEQNELRDALDRALGAVPPAVRDLLVRRYLREESIAEIATAEGQTLAHVGVRLQRARIAVRNAIDELFAADFEDVTAFAPTITNATRLWCPNCGSARLTKTVWRDGSSYYLSCPVCTPKPAGNYMTGWFRPPEFLHLGLPGMPLMLKADMSAQELLDRTFGELWSRMHRDRVLKCPHCEAPVFTRPHRNNPTTGPQRHVEYWCPECGDLRQSGSLSSAAMNHPRGRAFWRDERQIRTEPVREIILAGASAMVITLSAVQRTASLTFAYTTDATRLISIES